MTPASDRNETCPTWWIGERIASVEKIESAPRGAREVGS